jgi:putative transposase
MKEITFQERSVRQLGNEVKGDFWEGAQEYTRWTLKKLLEEALETERDLYLGHGWHITVPLREDWRNGYYERDFLTRQGRIEGIQVPRVRKGTLKFQAFERYSRYEKGLEEQILEMYLQGIGTRKVGPILEALVGREVSASTVSRIARQLDEKVWTFHRRPFTDRYQYLILDGIHLKIKSPFGLQHRVVLCAVGLQENGQRELLDFRLVRKESEVCWQAFLNDLYQRGVSGDSLRLVITDGGPGVLAALSLVYPWVRLQRCWVHKMRNVANYLHRKTQEECLRELAKVYSAKDLSQAQKTFRYWKQKWKDKEPKASACVEKNLEELLAFFTCPADHRKQIRTTNLIERMFREVRRRTRPMSCFNNDPSCERIIYAVLTHHNARWEKTRAFSN